MGIVRKIGTGLIVLAALVMVLGSSPASARTLDEILSSGVLKVGVNPNYPPMAMYNKMNELDGFDVDVSKKIAEMLGVKLEFVPVGPSDRVPFVTSGKIDYVMGSMTRTPARAKLIDFTVPVNTEALGVLTTAKKPFKSWRDLNSPKVTLAEVRGTTGVDFIKQYIPKAKLILLDNHPDCIRTVAQGRADAIIDVLDFLGQYMSKEKVNWKILKEPCGVIDYCALGVSKGNSSLKNWLNIALFELHENGFINDTWKKWYGVDMAFSCQPQPFF